MRLGIPGLGITLIFSVAACFAGITMLALFQASRQQTNQMALYSVPSTCMALATIVVQPSCSLFMYKLVLEDAPRQFRESRLSNGTNISLADNSSLVNYTVVAYSNFDSSTCGGFCVNLSFGETLPCWYNAGDSETVRIVPVIPSRVLFLILAVVCLSAAVLPSVIGCLLLIRSCRQVPLEIAAARAQNGAANGPNRTLELTTVASSVESREPFPCAEVHADPTGSWIDRLSANTMFARGIVEKLRRTYSRATFSGNRSQPVDARDCDGRDVCTVAQEATGNRLPTPVDDVVLSPVDNPIPSECHVCLNNDFSEQVVWWTCGHFLCRPCTDRMTAGPRDVVCEGLAYVKCPLCRQPSSVYELLVVDRSTRSQ